MDEILVERSDGLVTVTFNRPDKKNAINGAIWVALDRILTEVWRNPADRALLLTGAAGNFSWGADLSGMGGGGGKDRVDERGGGPAESTLIEMRRVNELTLRLQRMPKPTIAA